MNKQTVLRVLKLERWQGPPHVNKAKQYEAVSSFKGHSVYSVVKIKRHKNNE